MVIVLDKIVFLQNLIEQSRRIVFFGGAGVSTESGIPDFRSEKGLYHMKSKISPEKILGHSFFLAHPEEFFKFYQGNMNFLEKQPNVCHSYLKKLEDKGKLLCIITQNIDGLHQKAGSKNVCELHGSIYRNHCMRCGKRFSAEDVFSIIGVPRCSCGGIIKPDVVLYEEELPMVAIDEAILCLNQADLLIVAGTSLTVYPASSLLSFYKGKNIVIINQDSTFLDEQATLVFHEPIGSVFSKLK